MKETNDDATSDSQQQVSNLISADPTLNILPKNPLEMELPPIVPETNQTDNANQPILVNQVNPLPIHCIPLSDINKWGSIPHNVACPFCHQNVTTIVEASCNMGSCCLCFWLSCIIWAIILLCMGKEIGCADATHKCPNCKNVIGVYRSC